MFRVKKNYLIAAGLVGLMMGGSFFLAGGVGAEEQSGFVYLFKLYYDQGQLFADRDFEFKYDLIAENYTPEIIKGQAGYLGEIIAMGGKKEATFQFNVRPGKMTAKAPYFSDADLVNFYNSQGQKLLTILVKESSVCDNNEVCEEEVGESETNCSADCVILPSRGPLPSTVALPIRREGFNSRFILMAGAVGGVLLFLIIWFWRKRRNKNDLPPPQI